MKYEGMIIRPPSEAYSLLLQVTVGCSHNLCTFCETYKGKKFRIKSLDEIGEDIKEASRYRQVERVFLCDGDALIIPQEKLKNIIRMIKSEIHGVQRISTYGNAKSALRKSVEELTELRELGLTMVYLGVETGSEELLRKICKGVTVSQTIEAGRRIKQAGMTLSVTVILGLGGIEKSTEHALETARVLTAIDPDYVGALTLMIIPGTPIYEDYRAGKLPQPDQFGYLRELSLIISHAEFTDCFFTANHASNYLPIRAKLPQDKEKIVDMINRIITSADKSILRPEYLRAL
ncbi:MAG: radical SAM protein [Syntrophaceae bacterium]|nr:radical SAM protein [Syntrophaceae bacterium]